MNFGDLRFWEDFLAALLVLSGVRWLFWRDRGPRVDRVLLLVLSLYLFSQIDLRSLFFFLFVSGVAYFGAYAFSGARPRVKHAALAFFIPVMFLPLLYFKYSGFFLDRAASPVLGIGIPIGLSFYTFQKVAFLVDTLLYSRPIPQPLNFLNFAAFFPQLVAGPIERRADLLPQMERFRFRFHPSRLRLGIGWIITGLFFKCVLAENLAQATLIWRQIPDNPVAVWLNCLLFGLRIYYDFAGYSLIAYGLARCLGVRLTLNFRSPYLSCSIQEFWRRWHITLSQWFRDYIYFPLGGSRVPWAILNILIVFVASGLWHGAGWGFILWGLAHGLLVGTQHLARRFPFRVPLLVGWLMTNVTVCFLWLFFYETNLPLLSLKLKVLFSPWLYNENSLARAFLYVQREKLGYVLALGALVGIIQFAEYYSDRHLGKPYRVFHRPWILCLLVVGIVWLTPATQNAFIYFAF